MKYYLHDRHSNRTRWNYNGTDIESVTVFDNLNDLVDWAATKALSFTGYKVLYTQKETMYKTIDYTGKDVDTAFSFVNVVWGSLTPFTTLKSAGFYEGQPKRFIIYDEYGAIVDIRNFDKLILKRMEQKAACPKKSFWNYENYKPYTGCEVGTRLVRYHYRLKGDRQYYKFRVGSVPGINHRYYYWNSSKKYPRLRNIKEKLRTGDRSVNELINWDGYRHCDRSWKSSFKCRHQWEKHLVRRGKKGGEVYIGEEEE